MHEKSKCIKFNQMYNTQLEFKTYESNSNMYIL